METTAEENATRVCLADTVILWFSCNAGDFPRLLANYSELTSRAVSDLPHVTNALDFYCCPACLFGCRGAGQWFPLGLTGSVWSGRLAVFLSLETFLDHPDQFSGNSRHCDGWHTERPSGSLATSKRNACALGDHTLPETSTLCNKMLNNT